MTLKEMQDYIKSVDSSREKNETSREDTAGAVERSSEEEGEGESEEEEGEGEEMESGEREGDELLVMRPGADIEEEEEANESDSEDSAGVCTSASHVGQ